MNLSTTSQQIDHALNLLLMGKLVAIPTETVYGLAADARNPAALEKIYQVKGRPATNPLIIHFHKLDAITDWAIDIPNEAFELAERFWPGPLTFILKKQPSISPIITAHQSTIAVRVPNHPLTLQLLSLLEDGVAAPSANRSGKISPTTAEHVRVELGDKIDYILDGGPCQVGIESTILSFLHEQPKILRYGTITQTQIEKVLKKKINDNQSINFHSLKTENLNIMHPGQHHIHYAPEKPLYLIDTHKIKSANFDANVAVLSFVDKPEYFNGLWVKASNDPNEYAHYLYYILRKLDNSAAQTIIVEEPPSDEIWLGVKDRLRRASTPLIQKPF